MSLVRSAGVTQWPSSGVGVVCQTVVLPTACGFSVVGVGAAAGADTGEFDCVLDRGEFVVHGDPVRPVLHDSGLDRPAAGTTSADQVMAMLSGGPGPVESLTGSISDHIGMSARLQLPQDPIDRGQACLHAGLGQQDMKILCGDEVTTLCERFLNGTALAGVSPSLALGQGLLRYSTAHADHSLSRAPTSLDENENHLELLSLSSLDRACPADPPGVSPWATVDHGAFLLRCAMPCAAGAFVLLLKIIVNSVPGDDETCQTVVEETVKVRKSLRSLKGKPGAQVVRRHGKVFVINKKNPRYKARQG